MGVQDNVFYDVSAVVGGTRVALSSFNDMGRLLCVTLRECCDTGDRGCMF